MTVWLGLLIGATTLVATIVLGMIGVLVARAALFPVDRITTLEQELKTQKENLFGMRSLAKAVLQSSRDSHRFNDTTRRLLGTILENPGVLDNAVMRDRMAKLYEERTCDGLRLMPQQYLALELVTCDRIDFDEALGTFCEMGKDENDVGVMNFSLEFLESLTGLFDDGQTVKLEAAIIDMKRASRGRAKPITATWAPSGQ